MTITTDGIVAVSSGLLVVFAVLGLAVRLVLLPYLRDHLVTPVAEVREQVKNTHESNLREDIDSVSDQITDLTESVRRARIEDRQRWREHMSYSATIVERLERLERARRPDDN
jgi:uncharacterized membrane-anchored protein